jgi:hypothetical protein
VGRQLIAALSLQADATFRQDFLAVRRNKQLPSQSLAPDREAAHFCSAEVSSSRCAPDRRIAKRIAHPINPVRHRTLPVLPRHPATTSSAPNESCLNRFSCLNRRYNAGQMIVLSTAVALGKQISVRIVNLLVRNHSQIESPPATLSSVREGPQPGLPQLRGSKTRCARPSLALRWQLAECGNHFVTQAPAVHGRVKPHSIGIEVEHRLRFLDRYPQVRQPR